MDRNALKRFFEGKGPEASAVGLEIADKPQVAFRGEGLGLFESSVTIFDFGMVSSETAARREIEAENLGESPIGLGISLARSCFSLGFSGGENRPVVLAPRESVKISAVFTADGTEGKNTAQAMFKAKNARGALAAFPVLLVADSRRDFASARFRYNGAELPYSHEFRIRPAMFRFPEDRAYRLDLESNGPRPFRASFSSTSPLLRLGLAGSDNPGDDLFLELPPKASGSVFIMPVLPDALAGGGVTELRVLCTTNHVREELRSFYLDFRITRESDEAFVTFETDDGKPQFARERELPPAFSIKGGVLALKAGLVNWGAARAVLACESGSECARIEGSIAVPGFSGGRPGRATAEIGIDTGCLGEGIHRIPINFRTFGPAENGLTLYVNLRVFSIRVNPEMLDFGEVNAGEPATLTALVKATDPGIDISGLAALPVSGLKDQLDVRIGPDGILTATLFEPNNSSERKPSSDGPGISLSQPEWPFQMDMRVRFSRTAPRLYLKKREIDLGSLLEGEEAFFDLVLENRGDGALHAKIEPLGPGIGIAPSALSLGPGQKLVAALTVKAPKTGGMDGQAFSAGVRLVTNEPGADAEKISLSFRLATFAGRLCPNPSCPGKKWREVIPKSFLRCPKCGSEAQAGKAVRLEEAGTCADPLGCENRKCGGMYFSVDDTFRFCPYYGKPLVRPVP